MKMLPSKKQHILFFFNFLHVFCVGVKKKIQNVFFFPHIFFFEQIITMII